MANALSDQIHLDLETPIYALSSYATLHICNVFVITASGFLFYNSLKRLPMADKSLIQAK